jgi:hypothetical protein
LPTTFLPSRNVLFLFFLILVVLSSAMWLFLIEHLERRFFPASRPRVDATFNAVDHTAVCHAGLVLLLCTSMSENPACVHDVGCACLCKLMWVC